MIVVGCGPAGATVARVAAERGLSVIIIDRRRSVGMPPRCAGYVPAWVRTHTACDESALLQQVSGFRVLDADGRMREIPAPGYILDRTRFDKNLAIHALEAGADLAQAMVLHCDGPCVVGRRNGQEAVFAAEYLVGADGPASVVRRSMGFEQQAFWATLQYEVGLKIPDTWVELYPMDGAVGMVVPCGQTARIGMGVRREKAHGLKRRLSGFLQRFVAEERVLAGILGCSGGLMPMHGSWHTLCEGRALLVGDAGGISAPFSGMGIASAIVCGELAGDVIGTAHEAHNPGLLARYDGVVREHLSEVCNGDGSLLDYLTHIASWRPLPPRGKT